MARLFVENLLPSQVSITGPGPDGELELDFSRRITIGVVPDADICVSGANIGGRRNSVIRFDGAGGRWMLAHLGHSCRIYVNGDDVFATTREVPLEDGDVIEPVADLRVIRITFHDR